MSIEKTYRVIVEADKEGQFFKLPDGWLIDPENSGVIITREIENGRYIVRPVIDEDGQPNCKFIFPENEPGLYQSHFRKQSIGKFCDKHPVYQR